MKKTYHNPETGQIVNVYSSSRNAFIEVSGNCKHGNECPCTGDINAKIKFDSPGLAALAFKVFDKQAADAFICSATGGIVSPAAFKNLLSMKIVKAMKEERFLPQT